MSFTATPATTPPSDGVMEVEHGMHKVTIEDSASSWYDNEAKFVQFENLRNVALGNCRILYGSDRWKFYDIVLGIEEDESEFCVALVCSREGTSKVLRGCISDCPLKAIRALTTRLQKDSMTLLKAGAGVMMTGQQGHTDGDGKWQSTELDRIVKPSGPADNTETLPQLPSKRNDTWRPPQGAPRGPRTDRPGNKRVRRGEEEGSIGLDFYD
ncbi:hypothetical protein CC86DRAFT_455013 [Ophiobolus disseminans]|uniref:Uncharacterized protein n=1 Tax=Ophiobolus disseminans TaxID=1469910 RepID=A0A6A7A2G9_9PLEO|nr:hypothetical protein CC86DRAFT_455013 [Ophiobolus disseminans]